MNTTNPTSALPIIKTETKSLEVKPPIVDKVAHREIDKKSLFSRSKDLKNATVDVKTIEIGAKKYKKNAKNNKDKIIHDSFPFPEKDYLILSALKKACIAGGTPVKRGEIIRAGLHLLTDLTLPEFKLALDKVEKIPTGLTKASKIFETKH